MQKISQPTPDQPVWRYMRTSRFLELLETQKIYFASARQFEDPFEGAVRIEPVASISDRSAPPPSSLDSAFEQLKVLSKISCWHIEDHESDAMWRLYSGAGKGVAITSSPRKLFSTLEEYRVEPGYGSESLASGMVSYVDLSVEKISASMLERFFYKHNAFSWEKEYRLIISLRMAQQFGVQIPSEGISVSANLGELVTEVFLGPELSNGERELVEFACKNHGLEDRVRVSSLLSRPRYV